jgi:hypothetical protein
VADCRDGPLAPHSSCGPGAGCETTSRRRISQLAHRGLGSGVGSRNRHASSLRTERRGGHRLRDRGFRPR